MNTLHKLYKIYSEHPSISTDSRKVKREIYFLHFRVPLSMATTLPSPPWHTGQSVLWCHAPSLLETDERCLLVPDTLQANARARPLPPPTAQYPSGGDYWYQWQDDYQELTGALLAERYKVLATGGNLNNHIGITTHPICGFVGHEVAIRGDRSKRKEGEITQLCEMAEPTVGLITNIGRAHLEGFGSQEGILEARANFPNTSSRMVELFPQPRRPSPPKSLGIGHECHLL